MAIVKPYLEIGRLHAQLGRRPGHQDRPERLPGPRIAARNQLTMPVSDDAPSRAVTARLRGVHKSYGAVRVLDLPELDLHAGQVIGVVGENGAGKSTLMGTLAGSVHRDGGEIEIAGVPLRPGIDRGRRPARRRHGLAGVPAGRAAVRGGEPAARAASARTRPGACLVDRAGTAGRGRGDAGRDRPVRRRDPGPSRGAYAFRCRPGR